MGKESKAVLNSYFKTADLVSYNVESFNMFIKKGLQAVVSEVNKISLDIKPEGYETYE